MATRIDFSNIPFTFSPECQRYLHACLAAKCNEREFIELRLFPHGYADSSHSPAFILLLQRINNVEFQISGIAMFFNIKAKPELSALATNVFSPEPQLSFFYRQCELSLAELIEWCQEMVINDIRQRGRIIDFSPSYTMKEAINEIMTNWESKFFGFIQLD